MNRMKALIVPDTCIHHWCVYQLSDPKTQEVLYVGVSKIVEIFDFSVVISNPAFDQKATYTVDIIHDCFDRLEALQEQGRYLQGKKLPILNKTIRVNRFAMVRCEQTGKIYRNAATCAKHLHIATGNLSNHLSRKKGYATVKGMTFSYVGYYGCDEIIDQDEVII